MRVGSVSRESVTERLDVLLYREKPTNQLALFCLPAGAASHSFSFDHRRRPETLAICRRLDRHAVRIGLRAIGQHLVVLR